MGNKTRVAKPLVLISLFLAFLFLFTSAVFAIGRPIRLETRFGQVKSETATSSASRGARLDQVKLKVCQNRETIIKRRSQNLVQRGRLIFNRFDLIATRVEQYYTNKLVPKGATIANYDQMVANIAAKKAVAQAAITKAETDANNFSCSSDDPKAQIQAFRQDMLSVIRAMKDYKKSVIDLLVAVRTKAKNVKTPTAAGSATP